MTAQLSSRELEVVQLVADGLQNKEIAARLWLSLETIKSHVRNALAKTGTHTRAGLVAWAFRHGAIR